MYRIRKLKLEDMQACHDIQHSSHFDNNVWSEYFWKNVCHHFTDSWVSINDKDEVVGYVVGVIRHDDDLEGELAYRWLDTCFKEDVKGTGCADEMSDFLKEIYPVWSSHVHSQNVVCLKWLEKNGWQTIKYIENYYGDGTPTPFLTWRNH